MNKPAVNPMTESAESTDPDYLAWKDAKIQRAVDQAHDRDKMIPAEDVWKEFGLED